MHELAVCQALLAEVARVARRKNAIAVTDIHVSIGPLSGVEADLLRDAFPFAAAGTVAQAASLHIRRSKIVVRCDDCDKETEVAASKLVCGSCGNWRTTLVGGDELTLARVEMSTRASGALEGEALHV